jgi:hypothetical protein
VRVPRMWRDLAFERSSSCPIASCTKSQM